jgi:hypothetical protein
VGSRRSKLTLAGVPDRILHDFRRTAVRNLERSGVSRSTAMKMVGHQTEAIYRRYAIVSEADLQDGAMKLQDLHRLQGVATPTNGIAANDAAQLGSSSVRVTPLRKVAR